MTSRRGRDEADDEAEEVVKRRRLFTIPKDQQKILQRGNSSYHRLKELPGGIRGNIPPTVLDCLEARYRRNKETPKSRINDGSQPTQPASNARSSGAPSQEESTQSSNPQNLQSPIASSSPSRPMSWSPSPTSHRFRAAEVDASQRVEETPAAQSHTRQARPPPYFHFPSTEEQENELEVDIPDALKAPETTTATTRISSRPAATASSHGIAPSMQNTPPCAQPSPAIIPSTLDKGHETTKVRKRRNQFKVPLWENTKPSKKINKQEAYDGNEGVESEASSQVDSSYVVPATIQPNNGKSHMRLRSPRPRERLKSQEPIPSTEDSTAATQRGSKAHVEQHKHTVEQSTELIDADIAEGGSQASETQRSAAELEDKHQDGNSVPASNLDYAPARPAQGDDDDSRGPDHTPEPSYRTLIVQQSLQQEPGRQVDSTKGPLDEDNDPYDYFTSSYPSFEEEHSGSLSYFVRAAVVLGSLRKDMSLKSALYDDFVRAFAGGYMSYVKAAGPDRESMPAFEWYNWKDEIIIFTRGVLNRDNLDLIEKAYPNEYAEAKKLFAEDAQDDQPSPRPSIAVVPEPAPPPPSTSRPSSEGPPPSSVNSSRRGSIDSAPAGSRKPRPSGISYLQRLRLNGVRGEARSAQLRELGRVKRLSSGGSVTSSHASTK